MRRRAPVTAAVTLAVGGLLAAAIATTPATPWWVYPIATIGAVLTGLIGASHLDAPPGSEATVCDLRWPIFGIVGIIVATDLNGPLVSDALGPVGAAASGPVVGAAALVLLAWALRDRIKRERTARATAAAAANEPDADQSAGVACTFCTPLFRPSK